MWMLVCRPVHAIQPRRRGQSTRPRTPLPSTPTGVRADPSVTDAIDAMNEVPAADGGSRVSVQHVGPVNERAPGHDTLEISEFLRHVH